MIITRPAAGDYGAFYQGYIDTVPAAGPIATLQGQRTALAKLEHLSEAKATFRYADGKWSVKEVLGHVSDTERVFAYRLLRIARGDTTPLPGFDEKSWASNAPHHHRPVGDIVHELMAVREATLALVHSLDEAALARETVANTHRITARAMVWILAGHTQHHFGVLADRYDVRDALGGLTAKKWEPGVLGG